jgi:hypothetical protein
VSCHRSPKPRDWVALNAAFAILSRMRLVSRLIRYLRTLSKGRLILWCYFIWYSVVLVRYFDPHPRLWLTSLGLSIIIGFALYLSTAGSGTTKVKLDRWQTFRLFLMPFCVSSFAALVKDHGFILIFSPEPMEIVIAVGLCLLLCGIVAALKRQPAIGQPARSSL